MAKPNREGLDESRQRVEKGVFVLLVKRKFLQLLNWHLDGCPIRAIKTAFAPGCVSTGRTATRR